MKKRYLILPLLLLCIISVSGILIYKHNNRPALEPLKNKNIISYKNISVYKPSYLKDKLSGEAPQSILYANGSLKNNKTPMLGLSIYSSSESLKSTLADMDSLNIPIKQQLPIVN